jgi:Capsule assembly protein Wzi
MNVSRRLASIPVIQTAAVLAGLLLFAAFSCRAEEPGPPSGAAQPGSGPSQPASVCEPSLLDSPYIPVDSWVYPAVWRLYALDFVDTVYLGMRPYTRSSLEHMLEEAGAKIEDADPGPATDEAQGIYEALTHELHYDVQGPCLAHQGKTRVESVYSVERGISGTPLRDSFHLGSTIINDYGRPYQAGFNDYSGASGFASAGRFLIYARGEFQAAPSGTGYSTALAQTLANVDATNYFFNNTCAANGSGPSCVPLPLNLLSTIPLGPIASTADGRVMEAYVSAHYLNHEISFGKQDDWLGPGLGAGMAYSNNAENIYSFRINRIEPLHIPGLSYITGPFRYEFLVGSLKGHVFPNDPWVHLEKISFKPTQNLEFGFERTVIWGGENHEPITLHTFLKSFFSFSAPTTSSVKDSAADPGARFGAFDFSYRLPLMRKWLTFYTDSEAHDEVSPPDAPRRSSYRPGLYLSHVPGVPKLDLRAEAANTDPSTRDSQGGRFEYWEGVQRQGYTNKGVLFGDWIGREDKGGQAWATYHLSGNEWIQASVRTQKATKDFIPGGTTLSDVNFQAVKRIAKDFEINGSFAYERWKAPVYPTGTPTYPATQQTATTTTIQLTWYPKNKISF